jgi:hypothetical protein
MGPQHARGDGARRDPNLVREGPKQFERSKNAPTRPLCPPLWLVLSSHRKGQRRPGTLIGTLLIDRAADLAGQRDDQF